MKRILIFVVVFLVSCIYTEEGLDIDEVIIRPCPSYDLYCIREYLSSHSDCKIAEGPVPEPLYRADSVLYNPNYNLTVAQNSVYLGGLNAVVEEFYVNKKTDLTVLAAKFTNLQINASRSNFILLNNGREPTVTNGPTRELYPSLTITTVFKGSSYVDLKESESVAFIDQFPVIYVSPDALVSSDPAAAPRLLAFFVNFKSLTTESFLTAAPFYASTFVQYTICDFGLKLF